MVHVHGHWSVPAFFLNKDDITLWDLSYFYCNLNGKKGLYNEQGKLIIPFEYDKIEYGQGWRPHPFFVFKNGKEGLIDALGNLLFPCIYDEIRCIGTRYRIWKDGKDSLWEISNIYDIPDLEPFLRTESSCQLIDSSCFDFYKIPGHLEEMRFEHSCKGTYYGKQTYRISENEAKRWSLMSRVVDDEALEDDEDDVLYEAAMEKQKCITKYHK